MTDRDHFAAAALTGLLAQGDDGSFSEESYVRGAYRWADAMLCERCRAGGDCPGQDNAPSHDAAPAATAQDLGTGDTTKPVAWAVMDGHEFMEFCTDKEEAKCAAGFYGDCPIVPLYRHPQPTLTDAEREAVTELTDDPDFYGLTRTHTKVLRGLLERTGGEK